MGVGIAENGDVWVADGSNDQRAEAVNYDDLNYKPQEKEIKYFLTEFCRLYYSRNLVAVKQSCRGF